MQSKKIFWWVVGGAAVTFLIAAISMPNLLRARHTSAQYLAAPESSREYAMAAGRPGEAVFLSPSAPPLSAYNKKVIRQVALELQVSNVIDAAARLRQITATYQGDVDQVSLSTADLQSPAGQLQLRVPAARLEEALLDLKKVANNVLSERIVAVDVSHSWSDNDAQLRNLKAQEQQYLQIMKQAGTIRDTLAVAEKLGGVRGDIERLQSSMSIMALDVAMTSINIALTPVAKPNGLLADWHPLLNARSALISMLGALSSWVDLMAAIFIFLPAFVLWGGSIGAVCAAFYWVAKLLLRKSRQPLGSV